MKYLIRDKDNTINIKLTSDVTLSGNYVLMITNIQTNAINILNKPDVSLIPNQYQQFVITSAETNNFSVGQYDVQIYDELNTSALLYQDIWNVEDLNPSDLNTFYYSTNVSNDVYNVTGSSTTVAYSNVVDLLTFYTYTGTTATLIGTKLDIDVFATYTGNTAAIALDGYWTSAQTVTYISSVIPDFSAKVDTTLFNSYTGTTAPASFLSINALDGYWNSGQTTSYVTSVLPDISTKLDVSVYSAYTGSTVTLINGKVDSTLFNTFTGNTATALSTKLDTSVYSTYTGATATDIANKLDTSLFATYTGTTAPASFLGINALNGYWDSAQTTSYITSLNYLTGVTWTDITNKPSFDYLPLSGGTLTGKVFGTDLDLSGNLNVAGTMNIIHSTEIYSNNDFMFTRSGNTQSLSAGNISGIGVLNADGLGTNVLLGADNAGVMRVGWSGSTLVALAGREDNPINGYYAKWDSGTTKFITVDLDTTISAKLDTSIYSAYTASTATLIGTKLDTSVYSTYTGDTATLIGTKVDNTLFNTYTGDTATALSNKLDTTVYAAYTASTVTDLSNKLDVTLFNTYTGDTATLIGTKLDTTVYSVYTGATATEISNKLDTTLFNTYTGDTATALSLKKDLNSTIVALSTATTIDSTYNGKIIEATGTFTITLPNSMPTGMNVDIVNVGTGIITIAAATTLQSKNSKVTLPNQYGGGSVYHRGSNVWLLVGDLA